MTDRLTAVIAAALRDQLAWDWDGEPGDPDSSCGHAGHVASGVEVIDELAATVAAAIRDDHTVRTVEGLEELPAGTVVRSHVGGLWERLPGDTAFCWHLRYAPQVAFAGTVDWLIHGFPFTILYRPGGEVAGG